jgi:uncharacterized protein
MRTLKFLRRYGVRSFIALTIVTLATAWILGEFLTHPVRHAIGSIPTDLQSRNTRSIVFTSNSGRPVKGWFIPGKPGRGAIVLFHPVRGDRRSLLNRARLLSEDGYSVLLFDFQAHGESPGDRISFGYFERLDAQAAVQWLRAKVPGEKIGGLGVSLGGAAALLADLDLDAWVLEMVYPSIDQAIGNRLGRVLGPIGWGLRPLLTGQCRLRFGVDAEVLRPIDHIHRITGPKLLIAGSLDQHTPLVEAQSLFDAAVEPKDFWIRSGAKHVDLYEVDRASYRQRILAFFDRHL